jgi:hypothetical protein
MEIIIPVTLAVTLPVLLTLWKLKKPKMEGKIGPFSFTLSEESKEEDD